MSKIRKVLLILMCAFVLAGVVLIGCNTKNNNGGTGSTTYTVYVTSMGGIGLKDVSVAVTGATSGSAVASGSTDNSGKYEFKTGKGKYKVAVSKLPVGYSLIEDNSYSLTEEKTTLNILATSSVISETIPSDKIYKQGDVIYDFSIKDNSVRDLEITYTLSEVLETKRMVLLNFWNTHCGPCMNEMPELEAAYQEYYELAEVFAINVPLTGNDRLVDLRAARSDNSLSFPMALDENNMPYHFAMDAIPVSVVVDRYGVIALIHVGGMDKSSFKQIFAKYTADDYTQEPPNAPGDGDGDEIQREKPNVSQPDSAEIEAAINGVGFNGSYYPETESVLAEYSWPWLIGETQGVKYIYPANHEVNYSFAAIYTSVTITQADIANQNGKVVLVFDLQWSCENMYDYFSVTINDGLVYQYTGTEQWGEWQECYALVATEPGDYKLGMIYEKDEQQSMGADTVRIKNMRLISIPEISVGSLDMPRSASRNWTGTNFSNYVEPVKGDDGFYHMGSKTGPYILADLMNTTAFNYRLASTWSVAEFSVNYYFDFNTVESDDPEYDPSLDYTDAITVWEQAANNSELYGLTVVNDELIDLLNKFIKHLQDIGLMKATFHDKMWLEFCKYFDHYGTDASDKGISTEDRNPIRGLLNYTAIPTVDAYDGEFPDLNNIPAQYKNQVVLPKLIIPRGLKYLFVPKQSGVYRFRSQSKELADTMAWLYTFEGVELVSTDDQLEDVDKEFNFILTYYLKEGVPYIIAPTFADLGVTGEFTFTTEYLGPSAYVWQYASRNYITTIDDEMTELANYFNVQPVRVGDLYYNAKKDANGNYVSDGNGGYEANLNDPLYVDFLTTARFFDAGSLELVFTYSDADTVRETVSKLLASMWNKTKPSGGWGTYESLATIKGSALTDSDWADLIERLYDEYGDTVYIEQQSMIDSFAKSTTIGNVVEFLRTNYLNLFDMRNIRFDSSFKIPESRYIDYTNVVWTKYLEARNNEGDPAKGNADAGCVQLTEELRLALDMFCKRVGGFPELDTDWIRLCAHYEYFGAYEG